MKPKLLTKRQQLGIFNCVDPVAVMREYVSYSKDVNDVALDRLMTDSLDEFIERRKEKADQEEFKKRYETEHLDTYMEEYVRQCKAERAAGKREDKDPTTETQKQLFQNLSEKDAQTIYCNLRGHIYPEVLIKMLDTFPKEVSKELMLKYTEHCDLTSEVLIRVIGIFGKDAKEIILHGKDLEPEVFNKIFRMLGKDEAIKILIEMIQSHHDFTFDLEGKVERKILHVYSDAELKKLLITCIKNSVGMHGKLFSKIFDVCSSEEEIVKWLNLALENDMDLWHETLDKIVEYFPKEKAKKYLDTFFYETNPGRCHYKDAERQEYYNLLLTEEERELEDE